MEPHVPSRATAARPAPSNMLFTTACCDSGFSEPAAIARPRYCRTGKRKLNSAITSPTMVVSVAIRPLMCAPAGDQT